MDAVGVIGMSAAIGERVAFHVGFKCCTESWKDRPHFVWGLGGLRLCLEGLALR